MMAVSSVIRAEGRRLVIPAGVDVIVSDMSGRVICRKMPSGADSSVTLPAGGVYVIKKCRTLLQDSRDVDTVQSRV